MEMSSITDTPDLRGFAEKSDVIYYMTIIPDLLGLSTVFARKNGGNRLGIANLLHVNYMRRLKCPLSAESFS